MKQQRKRWAALGLAAVMAVALCACGGGQPSQEEVEQAIQEGTLTLEDALDKGWVDQEWVDAYYEENSVPAANKTEVNRIGEFSTQTLSGEEFTKEDLEAVTLFAFSDPTNEDAQAFFQEMTEAYEDVKAAGAGMVLCLKGEEGKEAFADAPFPVILYNDSLEEALGNNSSMANSPDLPNTASWCTDGSFLTAWLSSLDAEDLAESAKSFTQLEETGGEELPDSGETSDGAATPSGDMTTSSVPMVPSV